MTKELNKNDVKQYVKNNDHCPYCHSIDILHNKYIKNYAYVKTQTVKCLGCKKVWKEVYDLTGIELDDGTEIIPVKSNFPAL